MSNNLSIGKKILAVNMLCEGASIRSIERTLGTHRDTVMRLGLRIGEACERIHNQKMVNLPCQNVQVDELWGFINKKQRFTKGTERDKGFGDCWTYVALDSDSKIIPTYHVGRKSIEDASIFIADLSDRLKNRVQLSSDGLNAYVPAVAASFGEYVDYGQIVKTFSVVNLTQPASGRYSPADVIEVEKKCITGAPVIERICTSHIEKQNHTLRMHCRRLTRLTNAFSKKLENFKAAIALNFAYYNFVKVNSAVKAVPAVAAGIESKAWTVADLIERCGE